MNKKWMFVIMIGVLTGVASCTLFHKKRPRGDAGPEADALARKMLEAVNEEAWTKTGVVKWTFRGVHDHVWDRRRGYSSVSWGQGDDRISVRFYLDDHSYSIVTRGGGIVEDKQEANKLTEKAFAYWVNDSFWLNPVVKIFDGGTFRERLPPDELGRERLMVTYRSGGLTPGDAYLYTLGKDGRPVQWEMWVSILPVGGVKASFEGWIQLSTGAWIATKHGIGPKNVDLSDVHGAEDVSQLFDMDLFIELDALIHPAARESSP